MTDIRKAVILLSVTKINNQYSYSNSQIAFKAIPRASYDVITKNLPKKAVVYELEVRDLPFIDKMVEEYGCFSRKDVWCEAFWKAREVLKGMKSSSRPTIFQKAKILIGIVDKNIEGIQVANIPKCSPDSRILSSSRMGASHSEAELDFIATANPRNGTNVKNMGLALQEQLFRLAQKEKSKKIYHRSAIDPNTGGFSDFYKKCGYVAAGKRLSQKAACYSRELIHKCFVASGEQVIPIEIRRKDFIKTADLIGKKLNKQEIAAQSVGLEDLIV